MDTLENNILSCPDIGQMIHNYIDKQLISIPALGIMADLTRQAIRANLRKRSIQINMLWHFSIATKHNFLKDLAAQLPAEFTTDAPDFTAPFEERIAALEEQNKLLNAKVEALMAVLKK